MLLILDSKLAIPNKELELGVTLVTSSGIKSIENCGLFNQR